MSVRSPPLFSKEAWKARPPKVETSYMTFTFQLLPVEVQADKKINSLFPTVIKYVCEARPIYPKVVRQLVS